MIVRSCAILLLVIIALCAACDNNANAPQKAVDKMVATDENASADVRIKELLMGYWNNYDFSDTASANIADGEQRFSNFLMLLNYADATVARDAIARFIESGYAKTELRNRYGALISHYLENPQSPMRNDALYLLFLECELRCLAPDSEAARKRIEFKMNVVSKNLPGTIAPDFTYSDRMGNTATLHDTQAPLTLIIFNDPDCENCKEILPKLKREPMFNRPEVKVLMLYPDEDVQNWMTKGDSLPAGWIDAYNPGGVISNEQLYYIQAMPSLYLLDKNKRVILKDAHPKAVMLAIGDLLNKNKM